MMSEKPAAKDGSGGKGAENDGRDSDHLDRRADDLDDMFEFHVRLLIGRVRTVLEENGLAFWQARADLASVSGRVVPIQQAGYDQASDGSGGIRCRHRQRGGDRHHCCSMERIAVVSAPLRLTLDRCLREIEEGDG